MPRILTLFLSLLLPAAVNAQDSLITIDQCQALAKANYPLIKQYDLIAKSTEYTISNANKAYLPQVSITGIGGYVISGLPGISAPGQDASEPDKFQLIGIAQINQTIWDGGATRTQKDIATASSEMEKANVDVSFYEIKERVNQLYFGILVINEQLSQQEILKDNLSRSYNKVKLSKENGIAYQSDVDEVKAELIKLEQGELEFIHSRNAYYEMLSFMIGKTINPGANLEKPVVAETLSTLDLNRPELSLFASQVRLTEAQTSMHKVNNMPKLGLLGVGLLMEPGASFGTEKLNNLAIAGLSLSWNTGGLYRSKNSKNIDNVKIERIISQREAFIFSNKLQLTQTNSEIMKQEAVLSKDAEIVRLKTEIRKAYQLRYDNGMCSMNDLIDSINKESESQSKMALHSIQLLMSRYNYKTISGN